MTPNHETAILDLNRETCVLVLLAQREPTNFCSTFDLVRFYFSHSYRRVSFVKAESPLPPQI
jgi:hypothetical protein